MVDVFMCHKDIPHVTPIQTGILQLAQYGIPPAAIYHEVSIAIGDDKTCIITPRHSCVSCS